MNINHNRIKVSDLETNQPNKTLVTNENGELEFTTILVNQNLEQTLTNGSEAIEKYIKIKNSDASQAVTLSKHHLDANKIDTVSGHDFHAEYGWDKVRIRRDENDQMELYWNASTGNFYFPTGLGYKSNNTIITDSTLKTINGEYLVGNGNIDLSNKQDISNQIEIGTSQVIPNSWHGKTVLFTANCTLTVPVSLIASFVFNGITLPGVTVSWIITAPHTWLFGTPAATSEKQIFTFTKRGSTSSILLLGV
jgi:hypothetical protein